ncbi:NAD(+)--rifampin ADP-ribosyltransferase [uncultured Exiguobacterium sp.]|uniref:NAD(+)--rifampin ADP-ribosyltransferase n=1 Tax=uncultured Exiguobacterium sp. TaxID=202669 RepID=UPI0025D4C4DB|nr:NAD(+)--rifampin ADP-ribosyltransferase [uncultured Exiguobacterium sp.]
MRTVEGPYFHGTKANLKIGDRLIPGHTSNFREQPLQHVYFTATLDAAKWGAELARSDAPERIYLVEPLGAYEDDPNLTNKRFPGNPTRSYRSTEPVKIIAELGSWERHTDEEIMAMKTSLQRLRAEGKDTIID